MDLSAFTLSNGDQYDVQVASGGDANVALYKWVQNKWMRVANTSPTEVAATSQGGGTYITVVYSPGQQTQSYDVTLAVH